MYNLKPWEFDRAVDSCAITEEDAAGALVVTGTQGHSIIATLRGGAPEPTSARIPFKGGYVDRSVASNPNQLMAMGGLQMPEIDNIAELVAATGLGTDEYAG